MTIVNCAISGLKFQTAAFASLEIQTKEGYFHPVFAASYSQLYKLYSEHCKGKLSATDSYLLFLAFLHSSDQVIWEHPATCKPNDSSTVRLIGNNFKQLLEILQKTALINTSSFKQPSFKVTFENCNLAGIAIWIEAWQDNLAKFKLLRADDRIRHGLLKIEKDLSYLILSGEEPESFKEVIAIWADKTAGFPADKAELYRKTITSCFSINKMFNTPLALLKEIKEYCECNIIAGSIHFHTLMKVLKEGIAKHLDYLGGSSLALGYTLLPSIGKTYGLDSNKGEQAADTKLLTIASNAPKIAPKREDYKDSISFLRAKLAFRVSTSLKDKPVLTNDGKEL